MVAACGESCHICSIVEWSMWKTEFNLMSTRRLNMLLKYCVLDIYIYIYI